MLPAKQQFKYTQIKQKRTPLYEVWQQLKSGCMQIIYAIVGMFGALLMEGGTFIYNRPKFILRGLMVIALLTTIAASAVTSFEKPPQQVQVMSQVDSLCTQVREPKEENEAAPVVPTLAQSSDAEEYVTRFQKIAIDEMKKFGIPASISLAQGLIESRYGTSKLAVNNNNHFGIKCFSKQCGKGHCSNFTDDTHKDFFRKFKSPWESWRAHSQLLSSGRYLKLKKYGRDYRKWAYGLKSVGYATDRTYAEKLINVIEKYDLHKYDK